MSQNLPSSEARTRLDAMLNAWDLSRDERDLIWKRILSTSHSPDDPAAIVEALGTILDRRSHAFIQAIEEVPQKMSAAARDAAREVLGPVAKAATDQAELRISTLAAEASASLVEATTKAFRSSIKAQRLKVSVYVAAAVLILALAFGSAGWWAGRATVSGLEARWAATAARADSEIWLHLMALNSNLSGSLIEFCHSRSDLVHEENGARACRIPLWITGNPQPSLPSSLATMYTSAKDQVANWGPLWLLGVGLLAGLLARKVLGVIFSRGPIAWLVH